MGASGCVHSAAAAKDSTPVRDVATKAVNLSMRIERIRTAMGHKIAPRQYRYDKKFIPAAPIFEPISTGWADHRTRGNNPSNPRIFSTKSLADLHPVRQQESP